MGVAFIDTSRRPYLVVTKEGEHQAEELAPLFEQLGPFERLGVGMGPGSYTGIRVGLAFAKGYRLATGCALIPIPSLYRYFPPQPCTFLSVVDARAGGVYYQRAERTSGEIVWDGMPSRCSLEELAELKAEVDCVVSPDEGFGIGAGSSADYLLHLVERADPGELTPIYLGRW